MGVDLGFVVGVLRSEITVIEDGGPLEYEDGSGERGRG